MIIERHALAATPVFIEPDDAELVKASEILGAWDHLRLIVKEGKLIFANDWVLHHTLCKIAVSQGIGDDYRYEWYLLARRGVGVYEFDYFNSSERRNVKRALRSEFTERQAEILTTIMQMRDAA